MELLCTVDAQATRRMISATSAALCQLDWQF